MAKVGNPDFAIVRGADNRPATAGQIGIPRQRANEMKKLAQAGESAIRAEAGAGWGNWTGRPLNVRFSPVAKGALRGENSHFSV